MNYHGHEFDKGMLLKELGDVLWYVSMMAAAMGSDLEEVAQMNIEKLKQRYPEGYSDDRSRDRKEYIDPREFVEDLRKSWGKGIIRSYRATEDTLYIFLGGFRNEPYDCVVRLPLNVGRQQALVYCETARTTCTDGEVYPHNGFDYPCAEAAWFGLMMEEGVVYYV